MTLRRVRTGNSASDPSGPGQNCYMALSVMVERWGGTNQHQLRDPKLKQIAGGSGKSNRFSRTSDTFPDLINPW